jgi:hypothetical protein
VGQRRIGRRAQRKQSSTKHFFPNYSPYILLPRQLRRASQQNKSFRRELPATLFFGSTNLRTQLAAQLGTPGVETETTLVAVRGSRFLIGAEGLWRLLTGRSWRVNPS